MTCPTTTPCGPCAAVHSEDPAVYGAGAAPESTEAERLDRMMRAGPAALDSHELLGLLGVRLDACRFPALPAAAALSAGSLAAFALPPASSASSSPPTVTPRAGTPRPGSKPGRSRRASPPPSSPPRAATSTTTSPPSGRRRWPRGSATA